MLIVLVSAPPATQTAGAQKPAETQPAPKAPERQELSKSAERQGTLGQPSVERLGPTLYRIGTIRVDTSLREITVAGTVNPDVRTLEFIANAREGVRAYETAVTLDTDAIAFNAALLLVGIDRSRTKNVPKVHFDRAIPVGDVVEIWIECSARDCGRIPAERLMYDDHTKRSLSGGTWIYTGSTFLPDGRYFAQIDGSLIGFVHDPASIIEYAAGAGLDRYGSIILNPNLGLTGGTAIKLTVKAVTPPRASEPKR